MKAIDDTHDLRYLNAGSVRFASGNLAGFRVCTEDSQPLGNVNGVLINPSSRQLRYFVIETPGLLTQRRYLLRADAGATVRSDSRTLQIDARKDEVALESFNIRSVQEFSDSDLLETLFSRAS